LTASEQPSGKKGRRTIDKKRDKGLWVSGIMLEHYDGFLLWDPTKKGQWALHVYSIANFVAAWLKWLQMIRNDSKWDSMYLINQLKSFGVS
jgi:hypothetical protein